MIFLRSLLFNIQFYLGTSILVTMCLPCLLFPREVVIFVNKIWCSIMTKGMKWWLNTEIKVIGQIPSKKRVVFIFQNQCDIDFIKNQIKQVEGVMI